MTSNRKYLTLPLVLAVLATLWIMANPLGRFGWCIYAYTTDNGLPRPVSDLQIRSDGSVRKITKTHLLTFEQIQWLLDSKPDVLIIALGWDGYTMPDEQIRGHQGCETHLLKN